MALMKRIDVTSSTRAAETNEMANSATISFFAEPPMYGSTFSSKASKKWLFSKYPMMIIIPTRNRMTSRLANSMRCGTSKRPLARRTAMPTKANAKRKGQKSKVPMIKLEKTATERTCGAERPPATASSDSAATRTT